MGMDFTDRFLKLPIKVYSEREKEVMGKCQFYDSWIKIWIHDIVSYKPSTDPELDNVDCVHVRLRDHDAFNVYMEIDEFENALNAQAAFNGF